MSRLTDLIAQAKAKDASLGNELEREFKTLANRRQFGLNFERHSPESVELPGRPIRKGDKVRVLPPRGDTSKGDQRLWKVVKTSKENGKRVAKLDLIGAAEPEVHTVPVEDLIVVAEFRDYIYPGLVSTGKVERGGGKPYHTVINGENFHALEALTYTHRGKIDVIYIDPPYNTGAKDWKYNNNYVEGDDLYRHSKWLAFMERRLTLAKYLLNPKESTLIVAIDEKEVHRLALLLEQKFPEIEIQLVTVVINPKGSTRGQELARVNEYLLICYFGSSRALPTSRELLPNSIVSSSGKSPQIWYPLVRSGPDSRRIDNKNGFYPIYVDEPKGRILEIGDPLLPVTVTKSSVPEKEGCIAIWPTLSNGSDGRWQVSYQRARELAEQGLMRIGSINSRTKQITVTYIKAAERNRIESGEIISTGKDERGVLQLEYKDVGSRLRVGKNVWNTTAHDAGEHGTKLLRKLLPGRKFPFPKAVYSVEDAIRFFVKDKPNVRLLDFFAGSGTTAHAVMRLNKQDGGRRQCISVTNNEVGADEQKRLINDNLRPGDPDWEKWGICDYITKPRIKAAITGKTPDGDPIKGDYKFTDEFPMADGFDENAEFFTLTYETPVSVSHNRAFARIASLLWMKAGSEGRRIDSLPDTGWDVADTYGLLVDLDATAAFVGAIEAASRIRIVYIVTDDDRRFQSVAQRLPDGVEPVRLYESYLANFRFAMGR